MDLSLIFNLPSPIPQPSMPSEKTEKLLEQLFEKYKLSGQNIDDYLEGLLVSNYEPYWRYIALDTLLSLQQPKTDIPDETIFIGYHQITELYFKLALHELHQMKELGHDQPERWADKLNRIVRYFQNLIHSFDVMIEGMEKEQFLQFRMALLPASGFQSAQFRMIEMASTQAINLVALERREALSAKSLPEQYEGIYWRNGAMDLATGQKTLTLQQFEDAYGQRFLQWMSDWQGQTLNDHCEELARKGALTDELKQQFRRLDTYLNVNWRLSHYRSAVRYLQSKGGDAAATGGTNWQKFLPPRFQKIVSFPSLWTAEEIENWGKSWVEEQLQFKPIGL